MGMWHWGKIIQVQGLSVKIYKALDRPHQRTLFSATSYAEIKLVDAQKWTLHSSFRNL